MRKMPKRLPSKPSRGRADFARMDAMTEEDIMRTSPPELADLPDDFWDEAELVPPMIKAPISIRIDEDILEWFRGNGPRYQSRMNAVLRNYVTAMKRKRQKPAKQKRRA
jgi:uncharacterized protein (DUF4415 family)